MFVTDAPGMKCQDALGIGHRDARAGSTVLVGVCDLLQVLEILQTPLKIGQTHFEDRFSLLDLEQVKEGDAGKKLGVYSRLLRPKIAQIGLQQLDPALGELIEMSIGLAFLENDLPGDSAELFKAFEGEVERFVVEGHHASKRLIDLLFDLVAMPWALLQHGED